MLIHVSVKSIARFSISGKQWFEVEFCSDWVCPCENGLYRISYLQDPTADFAKEPISLVINYIVIICKQVEIDAATGTELWDIDVQFPVCYPGNKAVKPIPYCWEQVEYFEPVRKSSFCLYCLSFFVRQPGRYILETGATCRNLLFGGTQNLHELSMYN